MSTVQAEYHTNRFPQCTRRVSYTVAVSVHKHTNITHFVLRTLAHTRTVSKLTLASLSLSLTKSQAQKRRWGRKERVRERKTECKMRISPKDKKQKGEKRGRKNCNLKKHMWERAREKWCAWEKNRKKESQRTRLCFEGFIKREMKADTQQWLWIISDRGNRWVRK